MPKLLANATIALSLLLSASIPAPAWSAGKPAAAAKCHHSKQTLIKKRVAARKAQPARGVMLVEHRKIDVQILSFGP